jgi:catechol 2,3-dioxygenase-like lactoylglutathione lyase family enzyme
MARIKHIAIRTPDPEKTAAFYKEVFGLQEGRLALASISLTATSIWRFSGPAIRATARVPVTCRATPVSTISGFR